VPVQTTVSHSFVLYIYMLFESNKVKKSVSDIFLTNSNFNLASERVLWPLSTVVCRRRPPPSPATISLGEVRVGCVFLDYSRLQKGYKCYSPTTRRYYMFVDVTFFEDTPFFSPSMDYSPSLQQILPVPSPCPLGNSDQNVSGVPSSPSNSTEVAPPPLITYQCRTRQVGSIVPESSPRDSHPPPTDPQTMDPSSSTSSHHSDSDWPIAIRKGTRSTRNPHPIYNFLSYHRLSPSYFSFVF